MNLIVLTTDSRVKFSENHKSDEFQHYLSSRRSDVQTYSLNMRIIIFIVQHILLYLELLSPWLCTYHIIIRIDVMHIIWSPFTAIPVQWHFRGNKLYAFNLLQYILVTVTIWSNGLHLYRRLNTSMYIWYVHVQCVCVCVCVSVFIFYCIVFNLRSSVGG
jgi:hypothetical protein